MLVGTTQETASLLLGSGGTCLQLRSQPIGSFSKGGGFFLLLKSFKIFPCNVAEPKKDPMKLLK